jgi:hypothetical protein
LIVVDAMSDVMTRACKTRISKNSNLRISKNLAALGTHGEDARQ